MTTQFLNGTDSSSTTTGSVQLAGGVGIAKNCNVGGNVSASGTITSAGNITSETYVIAPNFVSNMAAAATGTTFSQLNLNAGSYGCVLSGGLTQSVGACCKLEIRNNASLSSLWSVTAGTNNTFSFDQTTDASSSTAGAVTLAGG